MNKWKEFREILLKQREELLKSISEDRSSIEVTSHGDLVDQSSNYAEREMLLGMTEHEMNKLRDIDAALGRIEKGTYGICEDTGQEIPEARLRALPTTTLTLDAQRARERAGRP